MASMKKSPSTSVTRKSHQMSIKVAQKWFHLKMKDFITFTNISYNMGNLDKIIVATGFESCPKWKNRPIWSHELVPLMEF